MRMVTGSTTPALEVTVSDPDPDVDVDMSGATVLVRGRLDGNTELRFSRAATSVEHVGQTSVVTMTWATGDTDAPEAPKPPWYLVIHLDVTWPDDTVEIIPAGAVELTPSLDYIAPSA